MISNILVAISIIITIGFNHQNSYGAEISKKHPISINPKKVKKWEREPESFAGLSLVAPIEHLPNCPFQERTSSFDRPSIYTADYVKWKGMVEADETLIACFSPSSVKIKPQADMWDAPSNKVELSLARKIDPFDNLTPRAIVINKKLVNVKAFFSSGDFQLAKSILIEKYGKPHKEEAGSIQTNGGASFPTEKVIWEGDLLLITLDSMVYRTYNSTSKLFDETGTLTIQNLAWKKSTEDAQAEEVKKKSNNL